jgi:hypothetical protein
MGTCENGTLVRINSEQCHRLTRQVLHRAADNLRELTQLVRLYPIKMLSSAYAAEKADSRSQTFTVIPGFGWKINFEQLWPAITEQVDFFNTQHDRDETRSDSLHPVKMSRSANAVRKRESCSQALAVWHSQSLRNHA